MRNPTTLRSRARRHRATSLARAPATPSNDHPPPHGAIVAFMISRGPPQAEEIFNWAQDDLSPDDCMLLDAGSTLYVWVGHGASDNEKRRAPELAEEYARSLSKKGGRASELPIVRVEQGREPIHFKAHFHAWSDEAADPFFDPYEAKLKALKAKGVQRSMTSATS
mmetsp:Transcript_14178/g.42982  ORF Transcript_14178/g.42982 Transcript_14178/m.42982 type:complete len:166 (-) Transcript_14178:495-992(-)